MIVLGIDTSTEQTSVAFGTEQEILGTVRFGGVHRHDDVLPAVERLLEWTGVELAIDDPGVERTIVVRTEGRTWLPRWERLVRQLEPWRSDRAAGEAS